MKTRLEERIAKLKSDGIKSDQKKRMVEELTQQVDRRKDQIEDLKGELEDFEKLLTTVQSLKEKDAQ